MFGMVSDTEDVITLCNSSMLFRFKFRDVSVDSSLSQNATFTFSFLRVQAYLRIISGLCQWEQAILLADDARSL